MLLQASGRTNGLRALVKAEQERGPDFLRLANALSALYPKQSEEKRLLDAMLLGSAKVKGKRKGKKCKKDQRGKGQNVKQGSLVEVNP